MLKINYNSNCIIVFLPKAVGQCPDLYGVTVLLVTAHTELH